MYAVTELIAMTREKSIQETNRALVLKAFDTLFNKRDYAAAERYWSPKYIQHSAHIEPGRDGLFNLNSGTSVDYPSAICRKRQ
jgi:predicted SnoaL-like aldol condensation-catalyzing enzyme